MDQAEDSPDGRKKRSPLGRMRDFFLELLSGENEAPAVPRPEATAPPPAQTRLPKPIYHFNEEYFKSVDRAFGSPPLTAAGSPDQEHEGKGGQNTVRSEGNGENSGLSGESSS